MTESPRVKPLEFEDIEDVAAAIREAGGRLTATRRLVLEALFEAEGPMSAERIASRLAGRGPAFDLPSVYRNLERLEALGVIRHVHLGHGPGLYALVGSGEREYLCCERCRRVTSVSPAELDSVRAEIRQRFGYDARFSHFPITGLCAECAGEVAAGARTEHSHGDRVHSHPLPHRDGLEHEH
jgi:Fur family transcriptional regulator, ferric uptake regulator